MDDYESVLLVKPEVFVYKIPPRATNRGYRASDWKLDSPDWTGKLHVVAKGKKCSIKLLDKNNGDLFAQGPIDKYPGIAFEAVSDSSRYFVLRIESDDGQSAFIGIGFADRGDSFDLNVALQDHFKWLEKSEEIETATKDNKPALDLGFKEGQTITINMNIAKKSGSARPRAKPGSATGIPGLLPPPPASAGTRLSSASTVQKIETPVEERSQVSSVRSDPIGTPSGSEGLLLDIGTNLTSQMSSQQSSSSVAAAAGANNDVWSDFTSASGASSGSETNQSDTMKNWMDF